MYSGAMAPMNNLPDPLTDPQFYDGVTAKRGVAFVIDVVIITALAGFVVMSFGITTLGIGFIAAAPLAFATSIAYRVVTLATRSATVGMMVMGIEFRTHRGEKFDLTHAVVHSLAFVFLFSTMIGQVISVMFMMASNMGRGAPDLLLGSAAINRPA